MTRLLGGFSEHNFCSIAIAQRQFTINPLNNNFMIYRKDFLCASKSTARNKMKVKFSEISEPQIK